MRTTSIVVWGVDRAPRGEVTSRGGGVDWMWRCLECHDFATDQSTAEDSGIALLEHLLQRHAE